MTPSRRLGLLATGVVAALVVGGVGAAGVTIRQGSRESILERKGSISAADVSPVATDAVSLIEELRIRSSTGLDIRALLRVPRVAPAPHPAAVLIGGIKRGKRIATAAGIDPIARSAVILSFDYPVHLTRRSWEPGNLASTVAHLRPAVFDTVAAAILALDYLAGRPDVDRQRLFLVGGSMGAEVVTVAGGVDPRPAAVIALYGGARLGPLIAHTLEHPAQRHPYPHWRALVAGHALSWLLLPIEPAWYAPGIAPRPFLMINGAEDSLVPRESVVALYAAARPPKELLWVGGEHVQPNDAILLDELSGIVTAWLVRHGLLPP